MNDAWSIMDIVILVCGVYALYAAYVLKTKGKIIKTFLVFKETDVNTCKDLGAYAASMAPLTVEDAMAVLSAPEENAKITLSILNGEKGPRREAVLMNAGAAFYVAGKADTLEDAVKLAAEIIDSGKAKARLDEFIKLSNQE